MYPRKLEDQWPENQYVCVHNGKVYIILAPENVGQAGMCHQGKPALTTLQSPLVPRYIWWGQECWIGREWIYIRLSLLSLEVLDALTDIHLLSHLASWWRRYIGICRFRLVAFYCHPCTFPCKAGWDVRHLCCLHPHSNQIQRMTDRQFFAQTRGPSKARCCSAIPRSVQTHSGFWPQHNDMVLIQFSKPQLPIASTLQFRSRKAIQVKTPCNATCWAQEVYKCPLVNL